MCTNPLFFNDTRVASYSNTSIAPSGPLACTLQKTLLPAKGHLQPLHASLSKAFPQQMLQLLVAIPYFTVHFYRVLTQALVSLFPTFS